MAKVFVQITAFDKNSNDNYSRNIVADCKEDFNRQVEDFESDIPFTKYYVELVADEVLSLEQEKIVEDYDVN
jgi:hypothetical protein